MYAKELEQISAAIRSGYSVLVLGEAGSGVDELAQALYRRFAGELDVAIAIYKGSGKQFFKVVAEQLDIPTETGDGKALTMEVLKEEIALNCSPDTLLILPEAKRLTTGIRYWLEDLITAGARVVCFAAANPGKDIFLEMIEVELELPSERHIRAVMETEAQRQGVNLDSSRLAELQPLAGRNPMLARKVIRREKLGLKQDVVEHTQYVVVMPVIVAALFSFAVVRFIGVGTGNTALYIIGGVCLVAAMALKQLGYIRGARKRLGQ
ncbi:hypothetical protein HJG54_15685 [Leptolyngbya sp. NK1-12]|uniref:Uncharacterized protein n=1 Tax=Leptolyngbya sp. NK1-12 TaxID=2547451 RepID=A0AA97AIG0_9CYAN|nr:hypothetical protein HJG54_15685 [Leptolyngbya sp. NK1-12]